MAKGVSRTSTGRRRKSAASGISKYLISGGAKEDRAPDLRIAAVPRGTPTSIRLFLPSSALSVCRESPSSARCRQAHEVTPTSAFPPYVDLHIRPRSGCPQRFMCLWTPGRLPPRRWTGGAAARSRPELSRQPSRRSPTLARSRDRALAGLHPVSRMHPGFRILVARGARQGRDRLPVAPERLARALLHFLLRQAVLIGEHRNHDDLCRTGRSPPAAAAAASCL